MKSNKQHITKLPAIVLCICLILSGICVSAQTAIEAEVLTERGFITLKGTADADSTVFADVAKDGIFDEDNIVFTDDCKADSSGSFRFPVFAMPDMEEPIVSCEGYYTLRINDGSSGIYETEFYYYGKEKREKLINDLNNVSNAESFLTSHNSIKLLTEYGIAVSVLEDGSDSLFETIENEIPFEVDEEEFGNIMRSIFLVEAVNKAEKSELAQILTDNREKGINLVFEDKEISSNAEMLAFVSEYISNCTPVSDLNGINEEIRTGGILYMLSTAGKRTLAEVVEKYADEIEIKESELSRYLSSEEITLDVNGDILISNDGKGYGSLEEFRTLFIRILENHRSQSSTTGSNRPSGGSGGGSGGGSKGGGSVGISYQPISDNKTETSESIDSSTEIFDDIADVEWAYSSIVYLYESGIVSGDGSGSFRPNDQVTREEFVKMLLGTLQILPENNTHNFKDLQDGAWYVPYVAAANKYGIVKGISEDKFGIGIKISRQDAAVMIMRGCSYAGYEVPENKTGIEFRDAGSISDYAAASVESLTGAGIITGTEDGRFAPTENLTRAQAAKLLYGVVKLYRTEGVE